MFHFTRRQRRRWSLPLIAVMVLHWCLGFGAAFADVLCLEPSGNVVLELKGQPCPSATVEKASEDSCIDLAVDDEHSSHESVPSQSLPSPDFPPLLPILAFLPIPLTPTFIGPEAPPLFPNHAVSLRATTVLLI